MIGLNVAGVLMADIKDKVDEKVAEFSNKNIDDLKLAMLIIEYSKEVEEFRSDAFGKNVAQMVRAMAKTEAMNILKRIEKEIAEDEEM